MHPLAETANAKQFVTQAEYPLKLGYSAELVEEDEFELRLPEPVLVPVILEDLREDEDD